MFFGSYYWGDDDDDDAYLVGTVRSGKQEGRKIQRVKDVADARQLLCCPLPAATLG